VLPLGESGLVSRFVRIASPDGVASLAIAEGVRAVDAVGGPLRTVTLKLLDSPDVPGAPGAYVFSGYACTAGPDGAAFSPPATLVFNLTEEEWDAVYSSRRGLLVQWYNRSANAWEEVPTLVHPETRSVTAEISHFSLYALFVGLPGDGAVEVIAPDTPQAGEAFPSMQIIPGLIALAIVGAGAYLYYRRGEP